MVHGLGSSEWPHLHNAGLPTKEDVAFLVCIVGLNPHMLILPNGGVARVVGVPAFDDHFHHKIWARFALKTLISSLTSHNHIICYA